MRIGKLKALNVTREKRPGVYGCGGGLYLQVTSAGAKSWLFRYWVAKRDDANGEFVRDSATGKACGRSREMGLGSCATVSLEHARERSLECRRLREQGLDPIEERRRKKQQAALEQAKALKFRDAATAYIASHHVAWKNAKHAAQWSTTLETYAYPTLGDIAVQAINTELILRVLEPIWSIKPETAGRLRGRIEAVLDWASARGLRTGENPARWRGHLAKLLPARSKVRKIKHHAALAYVDLPDFLSVLRAQDGVAARALEFTILTAARTSETIEARRDEIDLEDGTWIVPHTRMKAGKEHRVPLSARVVQLVSQSSHVFSESDWLFPGAKHSKPLSNMAMLKLLERLGHSGLTVHGFRSTFRDWAAECTSFPSEVVEMALAHAVGDKVEAAYRRGDLFAKRRELMEDWAIFCAAPNTAKVVAFRR